MFGGGRGPARRGKWCRLCGLCAAVPWRSVFVGAGCGSGSGARRQEASHQAVEARRVADEAAALERVQKEQAAARKASEEFDWQRGRRAAAKEAEEQQARARARSRSQSKRRNWAKPNSV